MELMRWVVEENMTYRAAAIERYGQGIVAPGYGIVGSSGS
jgi:hypothetical protein